MRSGREGEADMTADRKKRRENYLRQPYIGPMLRAARKAKPGTVTQIRVYHDDWCSVFRGGLCDCNPEVTVADAAGRHGERGGMA